MFTKSFATLILTITCLQVFAQNYTVSGKITDLTNKPLEYVTISIQDPETYAEKSAGITDALGKFAVSSSPGEYILYIESFGGSILERPINITRNMDLGTIQLDEGEVVALEGVVISSSNQPYRMELDKKVYDLANDPSTRGSSVSDALQNVPSVQVDGEGNISVRGNENVRIVIDGKPSALVGSDPAKALESLPADAVQRIEVVTNPSARYESEGTAGIINIILKKGKLQGLNGSASVYGGIPETAGASVNLNYRKGKWNVFTNLGYRYQEVEGKNSSESTRWDSSGTPKYEYMNGQPTRIYNGYNIMLGTEYYLDNRNTFTISGSFRDGNNKNNTHILYRDFDELMNLTSTSTRTQNEKDDNYSIEGNFGFKHEFLEPGHEFSVDARASYYKKDDNAVLREFGDLFDSNEKSISKDVNKRVTISADYIYPFAENQKLEIGARGEYNQTNTLFRVDSLTSSGWAGNDILSSNTEYSQNIYAGYVQYGAGIGNFSFLAGIRAENSQITVNSILNNSVTRKNYVDFFPSLFLNYEFDRDNQLQVSYSKRIRRPRGWDLIPFSSYSNNRNLFMGNPYLNPQFTDSYELSYITKIGKIMITPNVYFSHTYDNIQRFQTVNPEGIFITRPVNAGTENRYGGDLTFTYRPFKWWNLMGNVNVYGYKTKGSHTDTWTDPDTGVETSTTTSFDGDGTSWFGRLSTGFTLPYQVNLQLIGNYRGGQETAQNKREPMYGMDFSLSKDLFNDNATLTFNVRDVFNSRKREYTSFGEDFYIHGEYKWSKTSFNLNFTYRFNQSKRDQRKERVMDEGEAEMY